MQPHSNHTLYMRRALHLATFGQGKVAPNPMVGCVVAHPSRGIIGEGWHTHFGGPHAEVVAISQVSDRTLLSESTAYVTLEPCSHFGKTPPCADLLVAEGIACVVVACQDPNPLVAGKGIEKLRAAGVEVEVGILEAEARHLNRHFFCQHQRKRPFVTLKWAQTADGFLAHADGSFNWISSAQSRVWVHKLRAEHQAIMVGRNTLRTDNPTLTVRDWPGRSPTRLVVDPLLELPASLAIFNNSDAQTWIFNQKKQGAEGHLRFLEWSEPDWPDFMNQLHALGIQSVFVEGGRVLLDLFILHGLWDEALVFRSPVVFGDGVSAPLLNQPAGEQITFGADVVQLFSNSGA